MARLRVSVDDTGTWSTDSNLMHSLIDIVLDLSPVDAPAASAPGEVTALLGSVSRTQVERFVSRLVDLSRIRGVSFTVATVLNDEENQALRQRHAKSPSSDGHIVHVRPTEGPVLLGYFEYVLGVH